MKHRITRRKDSEYITVTFEDGASFVARKGESPRYDEIVAKAKAKDESVREMLDVSKTIQSAIDMSNMGDRLIVRNRRVYWDGDVVDHSLARQILRFIDEGLDFKPLVRFYEKIASNPSEHSRSALFNWLGVHKFVITEEGDIVGDKGMYAVDAGHASGKQYRSTASGPGWVNGVEGGPGPVYQSVGDVVTMPRATVLDNPSAECATGFHIGTKSYAKTYGNTHLLVLVHPRDVVSVPNHDGYQKMRVCRYYVLGLASDSELTSSLLKNAPRWDVEKKTADKPDKKAATKKATTRRTPPKSTVLADEKTEKASARKPEPKTKPKASAKRSTPPTTPARRGGRPAPATTTTSTKIDWTPANLKKLIAANTDAKLLKAFPGANLSTLKRRRSQALKEQG